MGQLLFIVGIASLSALLGFTTTKSTLRQLRGRRAITRNKHLLTTMRDKKIKGKFHTYNNLLHYSLLHLRGKMKNIPQQELEKLVDQAISDQL